jgi:hypothetical protein
MAGRPGRFGGHNRLPVDAHILRGTFNATRHGKLPAPSGPVWQPAPAELVQLAAAGRAFLTRLQATYELSPLDGELAVEGAIAVDRLAEIRVRRKTWPGEDRVPLDRLELGWQRSLSTCLLALRSRL